MFCHSDSAAVISVLRVFFLPKRWMPYVPSCSEMCSCQICVALWKHTSFCVVPRFSEDLAPPHKTNTGQHFGNTSSGVRQHVHLRCLQQRHRHRWRAVPALVPAPASRLLHKVHRDDSYGGTAENQGLSTCFPERVPLMPNYRTIAMYGWYQQGMIST